MPKVFETYRGFVYPWMIDHVGHKVVASMNLLAIYFDTEQRKSAELPQSVLDLGRAILEG